MELRRGLLWLLLCLSVSSCLVIQPSPSPTGPAVEILPTRTPR